MIRLNYNDSGQTFITTLYENCSGETLSQNGLCFYFEFKNDQTGENVYKVLKDTSLNPYRYNKFIINNITKDFNAGWYKYRVYKVDDTNLYFTDDVWTKNKTNTTITEYETYREVDLLSEDGIYVDRIKLLAGVTYIVNCEYSTTSTTDIGFIDDNGVPILNTYNGISGNTYLYRYNSGDPNDLLNAEFEITPTNDTHLHIGIYDKLDFSEETFYLGKNISLKVNQSTGTSNNTLEIGRMFIYKQVDEIVNITNKEIKVYKK